MDRGALRKSRTQRRLGVFNEHFADRAGGAGHGQRHFDPAWAPFRTIHEAQIDDIDSELRIDDGLQRLHDIRFYSHGPGLPHLRMQCTATDGPTKLER